MPRTQSPAKSPSAAQIAAIGNGTCHPLVAEYVRQGWIRKSGLRYVATPAGLAARPGR